MSPTRIVYCEDAVAWLKGPHVPAHCSFITSLPDVSETPEFTLDQWLEWFVRTAAAVIDATPREGVAIFYQTDIKKQGVWIDKGYLCQKAAESRSAQLLWHKIVCRAPAGNVTFGRPAYSHMLCFSAGRRDDLALSTADVLPGLGEMTWARAMGTHACLAACRYVLAQTPTRTVVDPFCGVGTVLAIANQLGLHGVGVERNRRRARQARLLELQGAT